MIPGQNILNMALSVIGRQEFLYRRFLKRATDEYGIDQAQYAEPITVSGSVQPVARSLYTFLGLEFTKSYWNFFLPRAVMDVKRDASGDQFDFCGKTYQVISRTPWASIDGWDQVLCVELLPEASNA